MSVLQTWQKRERQNDSNLPNLRQIIRLEIALLPQPEQKRKAK